MEITRTGELKELVCSGDDYVAAKATYMRLLFGKMGVFRP